MCISNSLRVCLRWGHKGSEKLGGMIEEPAWQILQAYSRGFMSQFYLPLQEAGQLNLKASSSIPTGSWQNLHLGSKVGRFKLPGKFCGLQIVLQSEGIASSVRKQATVD